MNPQTPMQGGYPYAYPGHPAAHNSWEPQFTPEQILYNIQQNSNQHWSEMKWSMPPNHAVSMSSQPAQVKVLLPRLHTGCITDSRAPM